MQVKAAGHPGGMVQNVVIELDGLMPELIGTNLNISVPMADIRVPVFTSEFNGEMHAFELTDLEKDEMVDCVMERLNQILLMKELKRRIVR